jgi:uncharacterized membrane protein
MLTFFVLLCFTFALGENFQACNKAGEETIMAVGYYDPAGANFISNGYWNIGPGDCVTTNVPLTYEIINEHY